MSVQTIMLLIVGLPSVMPTTPSTPIRPWPDQQLKTEHGGRKTDNRAASARAKSHQSGYTRQNAEVPSGRAQGIQPCKPQSHTDNADETCSRQADSWATVDRLEE